MAKLLHALSIKNVTADSADLYITGEILDDSYKNWFSQDAQPVGYVFPADVKAALSELEDKNLTIYINSGGGDVMAGVGIANMIKRHKCDTKAVVDGYAASIATQIFFSAKKRCMPKNTWLMIHKPSTCAAGNADDLMRAVEALDCIQTGLEATYNEHILDGVTEKDIHKMVNKGEWLTGADAAKYFDIELLDPIEAVAAADEVFMNFKNRPIELHYQRPANEPAENIAEIAAKRAKIQAALALAEEDLKDE